MGLSRSAVDLAVEASRRIGSVERVEEAVEGLRIASPTRLSGGETRERQRSSLAISSRREPPKYIRRLRRFTSKGGWGSDSCLKNNNLTKKKLKRNHFTQSRTHNASRETRRRKIVLIPNTFNYFQNQNIFHERGEAAQVKKTEKPRYIRIDLR